MLNKHRTGQPKSPQVTHREVPTKQGCRAILQEGINVCCWRRALPHSVGDALLRANVTKGPFELHGAVTRTTMASVAKRLTTPLNNDLSRTWLQADLVRLIKMYLKLFEREHVHASLELIDRDACRLYHRDNVSIRLLCTYFGPGTEWAPAAALPFPHADDSETPRNSGGIIVNEARIGHAHAGDIVILKGKKWPGNVCNGAVHRSPPIAAQGLKRLVFRIDKCEHGG